MGPGCDGEEALASGAGGWLECFAAWPDGGVRCSVTSVEPDVRIGRERVEYSALRRRRQDMRIGSCTIQDWLATRDKPLERIHDETRLFTQPTPLVASKPESPTSPVDTGSPVFISYPDGSFMNWQPAARPPPSSVALKEGHCGNVNHDGLVAVDGNMPP